MYFFASICSPVPSDPQTGADKCNQQTASKRRAGEVPTRQVQLQWTTLLKDHEIVDIMTYFGCNPKNQSKWMSDFITVQQLWNNALTFLHRVTNWNRRLSSGLKLKYTAGCSLRLCVLAVKYSSKEQLLLLIIWCYFILSRKIHSCLQHFSG